MATVDKKHQVIIDAQAFGEGQEHHTLQPVLETVEARFKKLGIADNIYQQGAIVTADTGFANEANMKYLHEHRINGYVPDNQFRSRDPKFQNLKDNTANGISIYPKPAGKPSSQPANSSSIR